MLPGETTDLSSSSSHVISSFPLYSEHHICQPDLILMFRLVSLHTSHLLQSPTGTMELDQNFLNNYEGQSLSMSNRNDYENIVEDMEYMNEEKCNEEKSPNRRCLPSFDLLRCTGCFRSSTQLDKQQQQQQQHENNQSPQTNKNSPLNLKGLLEAVRKGRVLLLNVFQVRYI